MVRPERRRIEHDISQWGTMTELIKLHEKHSALCATAHKANVGVPEDLTRDFDDVEVGRTVCASLEALLRDRGVAEDANVGHNGPTSAGAGDRPKRAKKPKKAAEGEPDAEEESNMRATKTTKKTAKKATAKKAKANARKPVKGKTGAKKATRESGKTAKVVALLKRAGGCTREDILKVTGWKAVSVQQVAKGAGIKLKVDESARPFKYKAA